MAEIRDRLQPFEDVPFAGHAFTITELRSMLSRALGRPVRLTRFPWWAMTVTAPVWELAREMNEMRYLWNVSHTLNGDKLARLLPGFRATPFAEVIASSLRAAGATPTTQALTTMPS